MNDIGIKNQMISTKSDTKKKRILMKQTKHSKLNFPDMSPIYYNNDHNSNKHQSMILIEIKILYFD